MKLKILVADDHPVVIDGVRFMLQNQEEIEIVHFAKNGLQVLDYAELYPVDVFILDIEMPELNGLKTTEKLISKFPDAKIIAYSSYGDIAHLQSMLNVGAKGYLLKNSSQAEILEAIFKVHKGQSFFSDELTEMMLAIVQGKTLAKNGNQKSIPSLSRREKEILRMIVDEATTPEIAEKLFISIGTVETHRRNMLNKLDVKNTAGLVRIAMQYQLV